MHDFVASVKVNLVSPMGKTGETKSGESGRIWKVFDVSK